MTTNGKTYNKGEVVPSDGTYVCVPCGFQKKLKAGETFIECTSCLAGTRDGDEMFVDGTELWEKKESKHTT
jgi:hypothetical protein